MSVPFLLLSAAFAEDEPCPEGFGRAADGNCYPLATTTPAPAPPPAPPPVADPLAAERQFWLGAHRRSRGVVTAGWITGASGLALDVLGVATFDPALISLGALGEAIGAPMIAGGSLRASRAVNELGGSVSRGPGYAAWALWGGGLAVNLGAYGAYEDEQTYLALTFTGVGCRVAAYVLGGIQAGMAQRGIGGLGPPVSVGFVPMHGGGQLVVSVR